MDRWTPNPPGTMLHSTHALYQHHAYHGAFDGGQLHHSDHMSQEPRISLSALWTEEKPLISLKAGETNRFEEEGGFYPGRSFRMHEHQR